MLAQKVPMPGFSFYSVSSYASVVLAIVILSVYLSHACIVTTKWCTVDILIPCERTITLLLYLSVTNSGWWVTPPSIWNLHSKWPTPFEKCQHWQVSDCTVSTVRNIKKVLIMTH